MRENNLRNTRADVEIELGLLPALHRALDSAKPLRAILLQTLQQGVAELMATLGIPGAPVVSIPAIEGNTAPARAMLRLRVNDEICFYSNDLIRWLYSYVVGVHVAAEEILDTLLARLHNAAA